MTKQQIIETIKTLEKQLWAEVMFDKVHNMNKELLEMDRTKWYTIRSLMEALEIDEE